MGIIKRIGLFVVAACLSFGCGFAVGHLAADGTVSDIAAYAEEIEEDLDGLSAADTGTEEETVTDTDAEEDETATDEEETVTEDETTDTDTEETGTVTEDEEETATEDSVIAVFVEWLQEEYGEDYEYYYDLIVSEWGSIYDYLRSFDGDDEELSAWDTFVDWLDEYQSIWAPILAAIAVVIVVVGGRGIYVGLKSLFTKIFKGSNEQAEAQIALIEAVELMLGDSEKTADVKKALEEAKKTLQGDDE